MYSGVHNGKCIKCRKEHITEIARDKLENTNFFSIYNKKKKNFWGTTEYKRGIIVESIFTKVEVDGLTATRR